MSAEDLKQITGKRAYRKRQVTTQSRSLQDLQHKHLKDIRLEELLRIQQELKVIIQSAEELNEEAYQTFLEEPGLLAKDEEAQIAFEQDYRPVNSLCHKLIELKQAYSSHQKLQLQGKELIGVDPSQPMASQQYLDFTRTCRERITDDSTLLDHPQIVDVHNATEKLAEQLKTQFLTKPKEADKEDTPIEPPQHFGTRLILELPKFDGQPRSWSNFREMFEATMDSRGKYLKDIEKRCLLENAMPNKEARDIISRSYNGDDPYTKSLQALEDKYGNPKVLLPLLVKEITQHSETYNYSREGLQSLHDRYVITYEHLHELIEDSLTIYLCQCAREHFSPKLREEWDKYAGSLEALPNVDNIRAFIDKLINQMEPSTSTTSTKSYKPSAAPPLGNGSSSLRCPFCKGPHIAVKCPAFISKDSTARHQMARDAHICLNCLRPGHVTRTCTNKLRCKTCNKAHHTMIHLPPRDTTATATPATPAATSMRVVAQPSTTTSPTLSFIDTVLVEASNGPIQIQARAALDSGAGISMISEQLATNLKLPRHKQRIAYEGIRGKGVSKSYVTTLLTSTTDHSKAITVSLSVIPRLNPVHQPRDVSGLQQSPVFKDLTLSDPQLGGHIDILLGNLDRNACITGAPLHLQDSKITLTPTIFGWSVAGPLEGTSPAVLQTTACPDPLDQALTRLWELEKIPVPESASNQDPVVQHFQDTHSTHASGRYIVQLPRVNNPPELGRSRSRALKRYLSNEKSLTERGIYHKFQDVLLEYLTMGHAEVLPHPLQEEGIYYMPVHGVTKEDSTTTKLRAVFDASAPTTTGKSLNDTLEAGPNLYPALPDILIRFRSHKIALTADIGKMFREILLHPNDRDLHRFFMRMQDGQLRDCRMTRLTFGVKSSPFIATQILRHLASQHAETHPQASEVINKDFYVDDCLTGVNNIQEGIKLQQDLCNLLQSAGMTLRKWRTNDHALLQQIPEHLRETTDLEIHTSSEAPKALGIHWDVTKDILHVSTPVDVSSATTTKRVVASITAQVFDVLGLMAPAVIPARILLQQLWKTHLKWDEPLPPDLTKTWDAWTNQLPEITSCSIPRRMTTNNSPVVFRSLHGFSDASAVAYGASVYLRTIHEDGSIHVALVTAKARVAPLKPLTIPRSELVAASLLTKLITYVARILDIPQHSLYAWTDSAIVLHWLHKPPHTLKVFVSNRVSHIQQHLPASHWRHVDTRENPADLLSRGCPARELHNNTLWWKGPPWLTLESSQWRTKNIVRVQLPVPEVRSDVTSLSVTPATPQKSLWSRFSSFTTATRTLAWARRFANNARLPVRDRKTSSSLTSVEITSAKNILLLLAQKESFPEVFQSISDRKILPKDHFLFRTTIHPPGDVPYITVSGRIRNPAQPAVPKRLIPLRAKSPITTMFLKTSHALHGHPGTETLLATLGDTYFIQGARNALKHISRKCIACQKAYARQLQPPMGLLPSVRTVPAPPFAHVGLDFAGPFRSRRGHTRKPIIEDTYVCLFVCLTTRAIHLDICADLSTTEFLATLSRFMARRGVPDKIYSDNGTNFVGASSEIKKFLSATSTQQAVSHLCSKHSLEWKFIPPRAPHFGGLWEAGVKSMKTLLRKVVQPHPLRRDEFYTVLTEVEATLNSRPLAPIQENATPDNFVLTPGHFLIQRPLRAPPFPSELTTPSTAQHLRRWALVQQLNQVLWDKWLHTYLQSRFSRSKWNSSSRAVRVGDVVLVRDITLKRRTWPLGRIIKTFPGSDGVCRTVELLCNGKKYTRATHLLCPLIESKDSTSPLPAPPEADEEPPTNINLLTCNLPTNSPHGPSPCRAPHVTPLQSQPSPPECVQDWQVASPSQGQAPGCCYRDCVLLGPRGQKSNRSFAHQLLPHGRTASHFIGPGKGRSHQRSTSDL